MNESVRQVQAEDDLILENEGLKEENVELGQKAASLERANEAWNRAFDNLSQAAMNAGQKIMDLNDLLVSVEQDLHALRDVPLSDLESSINTMVTRINEELNR